MSKIIVNGSLIPSVKNVPLDIRTRINTIAEVESIQVPFVGMIFYVMDEEKFYVVKALKGSNVGNIELKDTTIDTYEPLTAEVDLNGYATEEFVQDAIKNIQIGDEVDLSEYAKKSFVEEQIEAIEHPQYDDTELREAVNNKVDKIEGKVLIDEVEAERLANVDNYNDEEIRKMFIIDEPKKATFNNRPYIFACGHPILVEGKDDEVVVTYAVNDTNKNVGEIRMSVEEAKKLVIVGGFGNENTDKTRILPAANIHVRNVDIQAVYGGNLFEGIVGEANVIIENSSVKEIIGGGDASRFIDNRWAVRSDVGKVNIVLNNVKSSLVFIGGAGGPSNVAEAHIELNGDCDIAWLTAGGSNGFTSKAEIVINDGKYECVQMTNRGLVDEAKLVMNGGHANRVYFAGEAEDETVTGIVNHVVFELNNGEIGKLARGNSNSIEFNGDIKGHIMNCVVAEGDVSMLEVKVEEEDVDLSEYAKVEFVEKQIAAIEHPQYNDTELRAEIEKVNNKIDAQQRFEISDVPVGTLIDYREKEIRIMCPEDTEFKLQNVGAGGNANAYYMTLTVKAPEGAVAYREGHQGVVEGKVERIDGYRRCWLELAVFDGANWNYYGKNSTVDKYIGWTYCIEFYNAEGKVMEADRIRINLSNEECHYDIMPAFNGKSLANKSYVNEQITKIVEDLNMELEALPTVELVDQKIANIELKEGPAGKDFTFEMFTPEQLESLKGPQGDMGPEGANGVSVQNVVIENNHLMVTLSNGQVLDAGEMPAGQGGGTGMTDEERQELENLKEMKQQFLDLTYGVEYEWLYEFAQPAAASNVIGFNRENAPGFFADLDAAIEEAGDEEAGLESFIINVMEQDIYRMYVLRLSSEHRMYNRYEMIPFDGHATQPEASEFLAGWNPTANLHSWTWDGDFEGGFSIDAKPSSALVVALLKVKK